MKKKFFIGALTLIMTYSVAVGQASLLNQATNGLFKNVNDFIIKPNVMFNTVESKQILVGGGFDHLGFESNTTGGALLGYYHPSAIRWSIAGMLDLEAPLHNVQDETINKDGNLTGKSNQYKNSVFSNYTGGVGFTFGLPDTMNLSAGFVTTFNGTNPNPEETTSTNHSQGNAETVTIHPRTKTFNMMLGFPVGLEFTPSIYNFFEPIILISQSTTIKGGPANVDASHEETKDKKTAFMLYDKLTIQDLFPAPFGAETAFWIGIGNANLHDITELEQPASYNYKGDNWYKVNFSTQLGVSNLIDLSVGEVQVRFKPMVYIDLMTGEHKSITFGTTIAANAGAYVPLGVLPMSLFFGVTPRFQFYTTTYGNEQVTNNVTTTTKGASRALTTSVFWTGKIGTSIVLHKNIGLDVTFNVNTEDKSLGLSAQMSIAL